jgi:O-glycosyl hydrolase
MIARKLAALFCLALAAGGCAPGYTQPATIAVSPAHAAVVPDAQQVFSVTASVGPTPNVVWSIREGAAGGTITADGLYTAPANPGTFHVVATAVDLTSEAVVTVDPPVYAPDAGTTQQPVAVAISPAQVAVLLGGSQSFSATVTNTSDTSVTWSVAEPNGGAITATGLYTAPAAAGVYHVTATSHADPTKSATATVTVSHVAVNVSPLTATVLQGTSQSFTCAVTGAADTSCSWSVQEGTAGGSVTAAGSYTAPSAAGTFHVVAKSTADPTSSAAVTVTVPPVTVAISPQTVALPAGGSQTFTCSVAGLTNTGCVFSVQEASGGTVNAAGLYTAPSAGGTYHVVAASHANPSLTSVATVTVSRVAVTVSPLTATVLQGASLALTCAVTGAADTSCNWSVQEGAAGGAVVAGLYTAPSTAGTFHVVARSNADPTSSATATLTVPAITVAISPQSVSLSAGASQSFTCSVAGLADTGCLFSVQEAAGGTVSSAGLYTAPSAGGTYHVVAASHANPSLTSVATVTVSHVAVNVSPLTATVLQGTSGSFTCAVTGAANTSCSWSVQEGAAGGSVTSAGVYTAPAAAGTFHVVAKSNADPTSSATATITVPAITVSISPQSVSLSAGASQSFTCSVAGLTDTGCVFSVQEAGGGSVSSTGAYTAPATAGTYHVVAASHANPSLTSVATVTVSNVAVNVSPLTATVLQGTSGSFTCAVTGATDTSCSWSVQEGAAGGSVTSAGVYTAPAAEGTFHVVARSNAQATSSATATITVPAIAVAISPQTSSLPAGGSQSFTCSVAGLTDTACVFSVQEAAGGTVTPAGLYTAPGAGGTYHVVASSHANPSLTSIATVTVAHPAISVSPLTTTVLQGTSGSFTCAVTGPADTSCSWSVQEGAAGGSVTSAGVYTAPSAAGTFHVVAKSNADPASSAAATVTVPAIAVTVSPQTVSLTAGGSQGFSCSVTGMTDTGCLFSVQEAAGGTVTAAGLYTAPGAGGTYHVVAASHANPSLTSVATVTVAHPAVNVSPLTATVLQGTSSSFTCAVTGLTGTADTSCSWSVQEGVAGGSVTSAGVYTAPSAAGTFHVVARSNADATSSATATVTVPAIGIALSPLTVALVAGGSQSFTCSVTGLTDTGCLFSVQEAAGGAVTSAGVYTAPGAGGTYHVVAASHANPSLTSVATVTVAHPTVNVSPQTATVLQGASGTFTCAVSGVTGTANASCSWSVQEGVAGGSVTTAGVYTAPSAAGTFHVIAQSNADPASSATATVTVPPITVTISPTSASLASGGAQAFTCGVTGLSDTSCLFSVQEAGGGSVSATGAYTAPATAGTYHVVAASNANPSLTAVATVTVTAASPNDITINFADVQQSIDGFGAADIWAGAMSNAQMDMSICVNPGGACASGGIGLSLMRAGIDGSGAYLGTASNAQKAAARGAKIWAAPWSPPASMKTTGNINTGSLNTTSYDAWANVLAGFAATLKAQTGVSLYALSVQNEPDYNTNGAYAMCLYSGAQMDAFIKVLGPKLAALNPRPLLLAAETSTWGNFWPSFGDVFNNDSAALGYIDIMASHQYDYQAVAHAIPAGKRFWETEVSTFDGPSTDIGNGITVARWVHDAMTIANASAWHYWWLISANNDNEGLLNLGGGVTKRLYTVGNFSKFVRPGWVRIGTTGGPAGLYASAYKDPVSGNFAVVVINASAADVTQRIALNGAASALVTPQVTSASLNLASQASLDSSSGAFSMILPASTVTTFVGTAH